MRVWVVTIGEPLFFNSSLRAHRSGLLVQSLFADDRVTEVIWWTSAFDHFHKKKVYSADTCVYLNSKCKVYALDGGGYRRNISVSRIIDHVRIRKKFLDMAFKEDYVPDVIVTSFPTLGLCEAVAKYAIDREIPFYIDYRDMWPEVFVEIIPPRFAPLMKLLLSPLFKRTDFLLSKANGLISITESLLDTILVKANRARSSRDAVFPLAYDLKDPSFDQISLSHSYWYNHIGLSKNKETLRCCFFGSIGYQFDFDTIINALRYLKDARVEFIFCGNGDRLEELKANCANYNNVFFPGYIDYINVRGLMSISDIGLCPYLTKDAFLKSIPGKAIEYLSGGLPILTSLKHGVLGNILVQNELGISYEPGDIKDFVAKVKSLIDAKENDVWSQSRMLEFFKENFDSSVVYQNYCDHILYVNDTNK